MERNLRGGSGAGDILQLDMPDSGRKDRSDRTAHQRHAVPDLPVCPGESEGATGEPERPNRVPERRDLLLRPTPTGPMLDRPPAGPK
jgi:hypothetical protein